MFLLKRQVFFSFEYNKDAWRASQIRNMGKVDNSSTFSDNDWEEVKEKTDKAIKDWIDTFSIFSFEPLPFDDDNEAPEIFFCPLPNTCG